MTDQQQDGRPGGHRMSRRQLMRHSAWFGAAVVVTFTGAEVISHVADGSSSAAAGDQNLLRR